MTKKDYELIASVLADAESRIEMDTGCTQYSEEQTSYASEILDYIVNGICVEVEMQSPRFKRGTFEVFARPIRNARLRDRILQSLKSDS